MTRTEIINYYIKKHGYRTYLEIGVRYPDQNFNQIIAPDKTGVDPMVYLDKHYDGKMIQMESEYFWNQNTDTFDCIFIDGLHHASMVLWDIINGVNCLNPNGVLFVHDLIPADEQAQRIPQQTHKWNGDAWKAWTVFIDTIFSGCQDMTARVFNDDNGIGIIENGSERTIVPTYNEYNIKGNWAKDFLK